MSFGLQKVLESKRAMRRSLAVRPMAEKLRMLDALREREVAIRGSAAHPIVEAASRRLLGKT